MSVQTLLAFVNFKIYNSINVKYPPILDSRLEALAAGIDPASPKYAVSLSSSDFNFLDIKIMLLMPSLLIS